MIFKRILSNSISINDSSYDLLKINLIRDSPFAVVILSFTTSLHESSFFPSKRNNLKIVLVILGKFNNNILNYFTFGSHLSCQIFKEMIQVLHPPPHEETGP